MLNAVITKTKFTGPRVKIDGYMIGGKTGTSELVNPNGVEIKSLEIPSNSDGTFKVEGFKIPKNAIPGTWKINVSSGSNIERSEFEVISQEIEGIIIEIGDTIDIPGFGESIKFGITTSQKTSVSMEVLDQNYFTVVGILPLI